MLKRWTAFSRFTDDGGICLTNNAADPHDAGGRLRRLRPRDVRLWHYAVAASHRPPGVRRARPTGGGGRAAQKA